MTDETQPSTDASPGNETTRWQTRLLVHLVPALAALTLFVAPATAQSSGQTFCNTDMAQTIQNVFTIIQFGGPMLGGVLALGATVGLTFVRRSDWKKELKEIRNQPTRNLSMPSINSGRPVHTTATSGKHRGQVKARRSGRSTATRTRSEQWYGTLRDAASVFRNQ